MNNNAIIAIACVALVVAGAFVCCGNMTGDDTNAADTVVYGKIYTSNATGDYAEAIAVKDGKYVYVGDEDGVKSYIKDGKTKVIDYRDKGLIMAGATEGHGHYAMQGVLQAVGFTVTGDTKEDIINNVKKYVEEHPDNEVYYTFGWNNIKMTATKSTIDMRSELDRICSDKAMLITDDSGHNGFCNSKAFELAGVTKDTVITGGEFCKDKTTGELLGLVSDMAFNYILKNAIADKFKIDGKDYAAICQAMEENLHRDGYTYLQDGWLNYFGSEAMDCITAYDKTTGLTIYVSGSYKIDSYENWEKEVNTAEEYMKKYATAHFAYNTLKLFADGEAVESGSGWMKEKYVDEKYGYGVQVWSDEDMNAIVKAANSKGISVHVHAQGDAASEQVVNAFINAESTAKDGVYNGICHGRNITEETKEKMGEHHIYAAININWRTLYAEDEGEILLELLDEDRAKAGYPIKSLLDKGVNVSSSTDVPAAAGAPTSVCGIIEVAVNDTCADKKVWQFNPDERVTVEQAIDIMTINGAKQLQIEDTRGSIEVGKYADFLFIDKDITTCDADRIHEGNVVSVYFEGKESYTLEA